MATLTGTPGSLLSLTMKWCSSHNQYRLAWCTLCMYVCMHVDL